MAWDDSPSDAKSKLQEAVTKIKAALEAYDARAKEKPNDPALGQMKRKIEDLINSCYWWTRH
jgi:hypothetical protein